MTNYELIKYTLERARFDHGRATSGFPNVDFMNGMEAIETVIELYRKMMDSLEEGKVLVMKDGQIYSATVNTDLGAKQYVFTKNENEQ